MVASDEDHPTEDRREVDLYDALVAETVLLELAPIGPERLQEVSFVWLSAPWSELHKADLLLEALLIGIWDHSEHPRLVLLSIILQKAISIANLMDGRA